MWIGAIINVGAGFGANYGGFAGIKSIFGYKDNGVLVGFGTMFGKLSYEIGGQLSYRWFIVNLTYGAIARVNNFVENGGSFVVGGMINLNKSKRLFLDLGIGNTFRQLNGDSFIINISSNYLTYILGVSYRFGGKTDK